MVKKAFANIWRRNLDASHILLNDLLVGALGFDE
jgi:hypothetical protein